MTRTYCPRDWPYKAAAARDDAAESIQVAIISLMLLTDLINDVEAAKLVTKSVYHAQNALRNLEAQGAQTRPPKP